MGARWVPLWRVKPKSENVDLVVVEAGAVENPPRVFQDRWEGGPFEGPAFHGASDP